MEFSWQLVLFELFNFCLLMAILGRFLYRPVRAILEKRRDLIEQARRGAEQREREAEASREGFEARRAELEGEAEALRRAGRQRGEDEAARLVEESREAARGDRLRLQKNLELTERRALDQMRGSILDLAVEAAARVVGGMEREDIASAYARLGARRLKERRDKLEGERLRVSVSPDANPVGVRAALEEALGPCELELDVDAELVGGVRLQLRDLEVEASAGAALREWLEDTRRAEAAPSGRPQP